MHQRNFLRPERGFTLLEMSIVLVVIATIVAGIIMGRALVTTSSIQTIITDVDSYTNAVNNFKQAYQSLPGDYAGATTLWGYGGGTGCTNNAGTSQVTKGTCDGTGNGQIINTAASQVGESFLFWQQLNLAKMANVNVSSNLAGSNGIYDSIPGVNVPAGSMKGSGFSVIWMGKSTTSDCGSSTNNWSRSAYASGFSAPTCNSYYLFGNVFLFGKVWTGNPTVAGELTPDQAASIDAKMDDGMPYSGKVEAVNNGHQNCLYYANGITYQGSGSASLSSSTPVTYNVANTSNPGPNCALIFSMGF